MPLYATVQDNRGMCQGHGGQRLRGDHQVLVRGQVVWTESDTWQSAATACSRCEGLAQLLNRAFEDGRRAKTKETTK